MVPWEAGSCPDGRRLSRRRTFVTDANNTLSMLCAELTDTFLRRAAVEVSGSSILHSTARCSAGGGAIGPLASPWTGLTMEPLYGTRSRCHVQVAALLTSATLLGRRLWASGPSRSSCLMIRRSRTSGATLTSVSARHSWSTLLSSASWSSVAWSRLDEARELYRFRRFLSRRRGESSVSSGGVASRFACSDSILPWSLE